MRLLTKMVLGLSLATALGSCYVAPVAPPGPYYPYPTTHVSRCAYGYYWDGYYCRPYRHY